VVVIRLGKLAERTGYSSNRTDNLPARDKLARLASSGLAFLEIFQVERVDEILVR